MITYRIASYNDLYSVKSLLCAIDKTFPIPLSAKTDLAELAAKFIDKGYVYLAIEYENLVGMVGFYANDNETHKAYISVVGVLENYQGQGIGKRIVLDSLTICKEKGMTSCILYTHKTNIGAIAMYEKLGFIAEEDKNRPHDIKFVKKL